MSEPVTIERLERACDCRALHCAGRPVLAPLVERLERELATMRQAPKISSD
ncbi:hypothetical protein ACVWZK_008833 [Bradyrhizobium sp. GM0.4]